MGIQEEEYSYDTSSYNLPKTDSVKTIRRAADRQTRKVGQQKMGVGDNMKYLGAYLT